MPDRARQYRLNWCAVHARGHFILDIGPIGGNGLYGLHRAIKKANPQSSIFGVDIAMNNKFMRETSTPGVRGDIQALPFTDNTFDLVCASEILEHLANPYQALAEIKRVTAPQGHILLTTPNSQRFNNLFRVFFNANKNNHWLKKNWSAWHHYEFSRPEINTLVKSCNLKIKKIISLPLRIGSLVLPPCRPFKHLGVWWLTVLEK